MALKMQKVKSSNIDSVGYDKDSMTLVVRFASGTTYEYLRVAPKQYSEMMNADSVGSYFSKNIRNQHRFNKLKDR